MSVIGMALAISNSEFARAVVTIGQACGSEETALNAPSGQKQNLCKAAYLNANSHFRDDNNSRVEGAVAVVCAYGCIGGVSNSCAGSGGGGSPCSQAMSSGRRAFEYSKASDAALAAARLNGGNAHTLESGATEMSQGGDLSPVTPAGSAADAGASGALSKSCKVATATGNVASRIDCAMASDPSIPSFVKSDKFRQDFQQATGQSLDEMINKNGPELLSRYASGAAEHAVQTLKGKTTLTGFLSRAGVFVKEMISGVDEQSRGDFAKAIIPSKFGSFVPGGTALAQSSRPNNSANSSLGLGATPGAAEPDGTDLATQAGPDMAAAPADSRGPASADDPSIPPEENRALSLFARVSRRYHDVWERISSVDSVFRKGSNI